MKTVKYEVISEESDNTRGCVLFIGTLKECYEFQRGYSGSKYPSISSAK